jgi:WD40 repeat protein
LALSPDVQWVAAGSYGGRVAIWQLDGRPIAAFPASQRNVTSIEFHPTDSHRLISAGLGPDVSIWTLPEAELSGKITAQTVAIANTQFTPDGRHLLTLSYEGQMHVWDSTTWRELTHQRVLLPGARTFALDAEGARCAILYKGRIELRSFPSWALEDDVGVTANVLNTAAFSPTGRQLAVGGADGRIRAYDLDP